jgi:hypothetical protein
LAPTGKGPLSDAALRAPKDERRCCEHSDHVNFCNGPEHKPPTGSKLCTAICSAERCRVCRSPAA